MKSMMAQRAERERTYCQMQSELSNSQFEPTKYMSTSI